MSTATRGLTLVALAVSAALGACGGGGGGGGGAAAGSTGSNGGSTTLAPGQFGVQIGPPGVQILGLNVPVNLTFTHPVAPASVSPATIKVVTITDPTGVSTAPPGSFAAVTMSVSGATVTLTPIVQFTPAAVNYGFAANAFYEISFTNPITGTSVTSATGEPIGNSGISFFFRTPNKGFDFNPGYPKAKAFFIDDPSTTVLPASFVDGVGGAADLDLTEEATAPFGNPVPILAANPFPVIASSPARDVLFVFADAVIPSTVLNTIDSSSSSLQVLMNTVPLPAFEPKAAPGQFSFLHQQGNLTLMRWKPSFSAYPPGSLVLVTVAATVKDLAHNTKVTVTGSSTPDVSVTLQVSGAPDPQLYEIVEEFTDTNFLDPSATSALWASPAEPGLLAPVLGGGTGEDGPLIIDPVGTLAAPGETIVPPGSIINFTLKRLLLPTVEPDTTGFVPRSYDLSTLSIPAGWTVRPLSDRDGDGTPDPAEYLVSSPGHPLDGLGAPLLLRCTGSAQVHGTIDVSGADAPTLVRPEVDSLADPAYVAYKAQGGDGAAALVAAGDGGDGGDVLLLDQNGSIVMPLQGGPLFNSPDLLGTLRGGTGQSTLLTGSVLTDAAADFSALNTDPALAASLAAGEILLQPNLGVGDASFGNAGTPNQPIDENHPTFTVTAATATTLTVDVSPPGNTMVQPGENIGNFFANIAATGDLYLLGRLRGAMGADATPLGRGGAGAEPYVVVNNGALGLSTTGGGGGGGGSFGPGLPGDSDGPLPNPFVNQAGQGGGISLSESPGAAGGIGTIRGTARALSDTTLELLTQTSGTPLSGLDGAPLQGAFVIPNSAADGWMFEIVGYTHATGVLTVSRIQLDDIDIGLTSPPGGPAGQGGPFLGINAVVDFAIVPSLQVGGAGGGGAGVSATGTVKSSAAVLPTLAPGAGGGAGGGSLLLETANQLTLGSAAALVADGGDGGIVFDVQTEFAGGGGGGGGNLVLRAGQGFQLFLGGRISAQGGVGGSTTGAGKGGTGGGGFVRLENFADDLTPAQFAPFVTPALAGDLNVGRMLGLPQGVGQSRFYQADVVNPEFAGVEVSYLADTNDDQVQEALTWTYGPAGPDSLPGGLLDPPFRLRFNSVDANAGGFLDVDSVNEVFTEISDLVSARVGLAYDPAAAVLLYSVGEDASRVHRLDPVTLAPVGVGPQVILLPTIPAVGSSTLDIVSMAAGGPDDELFLLERAERRVHVISLVTGAFRRTITLPIQLNGAMTYAPGIDRLVFADNADDRLVLFPPRNAAAAQPLTTDFAPSAPSLVAAVMRDGLPLDTEIVGMAYDAATSRLWCTDALAGRLFQVDLAPGFEGGSTTGVEAFSALVDVGGDMVIPSGLAFDPVTSRLALVHATSPADSRVRLVDPATVDPLLDGSDFVVTSFGVLLPEKPFAIHDGSIFLRFRLIIDGVHDAGATMFRSVRIDSLRVSYQNAPF